MFDEYEPKTFRVDPIPEGQCSIDATGTLCVRRSDLSLVGIEKTATVLFDSTTMRVAIRKPRPGKRTLAVNTTIHKKGGPEWGKIRLSGVLAQMDLDPQAVKGRFELMTKEDLLIISLTGVEEDMDK